MKVYISADLEGSAGMTVISELRPGDPDYFYFRDQMTREVAAACRGAVSAGAEDILVRDAHGEARNLIPTAFPECVRLLRGHTGDCFPMVSGLQLEHFDALMFTGYHSRVNSADLPCSHTFSIRQFEDIRPSESRYQNLTKHNACDTAIYMLKRFPGDKRRLAQAREIARYAEDQFVVWRQPCRADRAGYKRVQTYPYETWMTPVALEQYSCYAPIDGSVAKLIRTWLALWEAERNPLDLAKARTLGDATVNMQEPSGRVRTYWVPEPGDGTPIGKVARQPEGGDWLGCLQADEWALGLLAGI